MSRTMPCDILSDLSGLYPLFQLDQSGVPFGQVENRLLWIAFAVRFSDEAYQHRAERGDDTARLASSGDFALLKSHHTVGEVHILKCEFLQIAPPYACVQAEKEATFYIGAAPSEWRFRKFPDLVH